MFYWATPKGTHMEDMQAIYKEYSRNIWRNIQEYVRNTHKYLWYRIIRNTRNRPNGAVAKRPPHWGRRRRRRLCVLCFWLFLRNRGGLYKNPMPKPVLANLVLGMGFYTARPGSWSTSSQYWSICTWKIHSEIYDKIILSTFAPMHTIIFSTLSADV